MQHRAVFLICAPEDRQLADQIATDVHTASGLTVWCEAPASDNSSPAESAQQRLDQAQAAIVLLSPYSAASEYVLAQILYAQRIGVLIIPVLCAECTGPVTFCLNHLEWVVRRDGVPLARAIDQYLEQKRAL